MKYFIVFMVSIVLSACGNKSGGDQSSGTTEQTEAQSYQIYFDDIDIEKAKALINQNKDLVLLDVRTP